MNTSRFGIPVLAFLLGLCSGASAVRGAYVGDGAVLSGFTLTNGATYTESQMVAFNSIIRFNTAVTDADFFFPAGSMSATVTVTVADDALPENDEQVVLTFTDSTDVRFGTPSVHTLTIAHNDGMPAILSFSINGGATSTTDPHVTLDSVCDGTPAGYLASEDPDFAGATWQAYAPSLPFTLSAGLGTKTVYFKVRVSDGLGGYAETLAVPCVIARIPSLAEALDVTVPVTTSGDWVGWYGQTNDTHDGIDAARSGFFDGTNGTSWVDMNVIGPGNVSFWWKVHNNSGILWYSYMYFIVDGTYLMVLGNPDSWDHVTTCLTPGPHTLRWKYYQNYGSDGAYYSGYGEVDQVELPPPSASFATASETVDEGAGTVALTATLSYAGTGDVAVAYALSGTATPTNDYAVSEWTFFFPTGSTSATVHVSIVDDALPEHVETLVLALQPDGVSAGAGAILTNTLTIASNDGMPEVQVFQINGGALETTNRVVTLDNTCVGTPTEYMASEDPGFDGAAWLAYGTSPTFALSEGFGGKTVYFKVRAPDGLGGYLESLATHASINYLLLPLSEALDVTVPVTTGGDWVGWYGQTNDTYDGIDAACSGFFDGTNGTSWINMTVNGPGDMSFWWKLNDHNYSGSGYNYLYFYVDGGYVADLFTIGLWCPVSTYLSPGPHTLQWMYCQPYGSFGSYYCGYGELDQVELPLPAVSFTAASETVDEGVGTVALTATLSYASTGDVTVPYALSGTATPTNDYTVSEGAFFFPAGSISATVNVSIVDDALPEHAETVVLVLQPDGVSVTAGTVPANTLTIALNDGMPEVQVFQINGGVLETTTRVVTLDNTCVGTPTEYQASEDPGFDGAGWLAYGTSPVFTLSAGFDAKAVYFKVHAPDGFGGYLESLVASASIDLVPPPLEIVTPSLPTGQVGVAYSFALAGTGGVPPYVWSGPHGSSYGETAAPNSFTTVGTDTGWDADDDAWDLALPFDFPYYGTTYTHCWVNSNGKICFNAYDNSMSSDPSDLYLKRMLAALGNDLVTRIYYESPSAHECTIRWNGHYYDSSSPVAFSVTLYDDGTIQMKYGAGNGVGGSIGVSDGSGTNYLISSHCNTEMNSADDIIFTPLAGLPEGFTISTNGVLSGTPLAAGTNEVTVWLTDSTLASTNRTYELVVAAAMRPRATVILLR